MEKHYKRISKWGKITGMFLIIVGIVTLTTFALQLAGVIEQDAPGGILFIFGVILYLLGKESEKYLKEPSEETKDRMIKHVAELVILFTILSLISIVATIGAFAWVFVF